MTPRVNQRISEDRKAIEAWDKQISTMAPKFEKPSSAEKKLVAATLAGYPLKQRKHAHSKLEGSQEFELKSKKTTTPESHTEKSAKHESFGSMLANSFGRYPERSPAISQSPAFSKTSFEKSHIIAEPSNSNAADTHSIISSGSSSQKAGDTSFSGSSVTSAPAPKKKRNILGLSTSRDVSEDRRKDDTPKKERRLEKQPSMMSMGMAGPPPLYYDPTTPKKKKEKRNTTF